MRGHGRGERALSSDRKGGPADTDVSPEAVGPGLEERLGRLDQILAELEADDIELERALSLFEEGVAHVRAAERLLAEADLRVEELLGKGERTDVLQGEEGVNG